MLLAHSQYSNLPVIQIADFSGAWGVSFLLMLVNYAVYLALTRPRKQASFGLLLTVFVFTCCLFYGYTRLYPAIGATGKGLAEVKISVIQATTLRLNIEQTLYVFLMYEVLLTV